MVEGGAVRAMKPWALFKSRPQPWERLFLRCESGSDEFYVCEIYSTEFQMQRAIQRQDMNDRKAKRQSAVDRQCRACCYSYRAYDGRGRVTPEWGTLFFHKNYLTPAALAHEFTHAAHNWARRRRLLTARRNRDHYATDAEERVCHMVGYLMWQFYEKQPKRVFYISGAKMTHKDACSIRNAR